MDLAAVVHCARSNVLTEARIWFSRSVEQTLLPDDCQNMIVLSEEFYRGISSHPISAEFIPRQEVRQIGNVHLA